MPPRFVPVGVARPGAARFSGGRGTGTVPLPDTAGAGGHISRVLPAREGREQQRGQVGETPPNALGAPGGILGLISPSKQGNTSRDPAGDGMWGEKTLGQPQLHFPISILHGKSHPAPGWEKDAAPHVGSHRVGWGGHKGGPVPTKPGRREWGGGTPDPNPPFPTLPWHPGDVLPILPGFYPIFYL